MAEKPKITDAEFEVVDAPEDIASEISKHGITMAVGMLTFGVAFYFGVNSPSSGQAVWVGAAGASFAAAVRAAWKLFPALRRQRSAPEREGSAEARKRITSVRD